jgi:high-affinity Fe2+/Pb2+ permease
MAGVTAGQLGTVLMIVIFLIIVFWRIAIPLLAAFVLAKVMVAVMGTMAAVQGTGAPTAAVFLPLLM